MNLKYIGLGFLIALILMVLPASAQENTSFTPTDCPFDQYGYAFTCGMVTVPENHLVDNGETIQLAVAIIHTHNPDPEPDPVMYLSGGPGGAFVDAAPSMPLAFNFNSILVNRDVIIVDQRGMGLSQPNFNCIPFSSVEDAFNLNLDNYLANMASCIPEFEAQGIDWQAYTTEQSAADLALVPAALGYGEYNIFAHSYGTMLAQVMLRDYPENIRSAILDSVVALNANSFETSAINGSNMFSVIEADCQADLMCNWAYPNLRQLYLDTYERLTENPVTITVDGFDVAINGRMFADFVNLNMGSRESISQLPALIMAFAEDDFEIVEKFIRDVVATPLDEYPNQALLMTMVCPHNAPYTNAQSIIDVHSTVAEPFRNASFNESTLLLCSAWEGVPAASQALADSDVPTLLLGGGYDGVTPQQWAHDAATELSNATVIDVPYVGHLTNSNSCVQGLIVRFINAPTQSIESSCTENIKPVGFILHATVTRAPIRIVALILAIIALFAVGQVLFYGLSDLRRTAWVMAFKRQGWLPLLSLAIVLLMFWTNASVLPDDLVSIGVLQAIIPLLTAIQAAGVFSPGDEPALEVQMSATRSIVWLVVERLVVVYITYTAIAALGIGLSLLINPEQNIPILLLGWLPSALFLSGLGVYISIRSGMVALGMLTIAFLWFIFGLFASYFIPGQLFPPPIHLVQPFLWAIHVHASLDNLTLADYWLNRLFLSGTGIGLMMMAVYQVRDAETLLLGVRSKAANRSKKAENTIVPNLKPSLTLEAVSTRIMPLHQIMGIAKYSFIMRMRSRGLKVFVLAPLAMFGLFVISMGDFSFLPGFEVSGNLPTDQYRIVLGEMMTALTSSIFFVPAIYLYPILVADTITSDEGIHVDEVLNGLPVAYWVTLIGRVLGTVLAGALAMLGAMLIVALFGLVRDGVFNPSPFIDFIIGMLIAMSLMSGISILAGATQATGRRAVALTIALIILPEFLQSNLIIATLFPSRIQIYLMYIQSAIDNMLFQPITLREWTLFTPEMLQSLGASCVQMLLFGCIAWVWHQYRQSSK